MLISCLAGKSDFCGKGNLYFGFYSLIRYKLQPHLVGLSLARYKGFKLSLLIERGYTMLDGKLDQSWEIFDIQLVKYAAAICLDGFN